MKRIPDGSIDLVVTSPPYDDVRTYNGFTLDWKRIARHLTRVIKPGGVIVWVVADQTKKGSESGTSFEQALYFKNKCGLSLHDTMIYERFVPPLTHKRYEQHFEYMFVFVKGRKGPRVFNGIRVPKIYTEKTPRVKGYTRNPDGTRDIGSSHARHSDPTKLDSNVWHIDVGRLPKQEQFLHKHPAIFPRRLAERHIATWSNVGDIVLDPFCGCGTTGRTALELGRRFIGIEISPEYMELTKQHLALAK